MQISVPRLPSTTPRPDAARTTAAALTAALTTGTAVTGDSVVLSEAALAASDRLTASRTLDAQDRLPVSAIPTPIPPLGAFVQGGQVGTATPPAPEAPRWEHLLYAPLPIAWAAPRPAGPPVLSHVTKVSLVAGAVALAVLIGMWIG